MYLSSHKTMKLEFFKKICILVSIAPIAQMVEQQPFKLMVVGSIPTGGTKFIWGNIATNGSRKELSGH